MDVSELWQKNSAGDQKAREQLILAYMPLVKSTAKRIKDKLPGSVDLDDLVSSGTFGMIEALDRFDPSRGHKFETFALKRIQGAIYDGLRAMEWTPRTVYTQQREVETASQGLQATLQRAPTDHEIARDLGWDTDKIHRVKGKTNASSVESLNRNLHPGDWDGPDLTLGDSLAAPESDSARLELSELQNALADAIGGLGERERAVLVLYYFEQLKFSEIGTLFKVSESRICQIHMAAIEDIRSAMQG